MRNATINAHATPKTSCTGAMAPGCWTGRQNPVSELRGHPPLPTEPTGEVVAALFLPLPVRWRAKSVPRNAASSIYPLRHSGYSIKGTLNFVTDPRDLVCKAVNRALRHWQARRLRRQDRPLDRQGCGLRSDVGKNPGRHRAQIGAMTNGAWRAQVCGGSAITTRTIKELHRVTRIGLGDAVWQAANRYDAEAGSLASGM